MGPINVNCAETIFKQMTSSHHFIHISQNILNLWMRLIFPKTTHPGFQFEYKNEAIPIRIESDMIFRSWLYILLQQLQKNRTLLAPHSHQFSHLLHQISPKAKMRSKFMILCQLSLNGLPLFPPLLLYIPPLSFIPKAHKNPLSSPLLSSSKVE